jgi:hypothetical protein
MHGCAHIFQTILGMIKGKGKGIDMAQEIATLAEELRPLIGVTEAEDRRQGMLLMNTGTICNFVDKVAAKLIE